MWPANPSSYWLYLWETVDRRVGGIAYLDGNGRPHLVTAIYNSDRSNNITILLNRIEVAPRAVSAASGSPIVAPESLATQSSEEGMALGLGVSTFFGRTTRGCVVAPAT